MIPTPDRLAAAELMIRIWRIFCISVLKKMASSGPLRDTDLIDCARANFTKGIEVTAQRCGYGQDLAAFEQALNQAGEHIGVKIHHFEDLATDQQSDERGVEVGPDTPTQL